jgi:hypothetical protein
MTKTKTRAPVWLYHVHNCASHLPLHAKCNGAGHPCLPKALAVLQSAVEGLKALIDEIEGEGVSEKAPCDVTELI